MEEAERRGDVLEAGEFREHLERVEAMIDLSGSNRDRSRWSAADTKTNAVGVNSWPRQFNGLGKSRVRVRSERSERLRGCRKSQETRSGWTKIWRPIPHPTYWGSRGHGLCTGRSSAFLYDRSDVPRKGLQAVIRDAAHGRGIRFPGTLSRRRRWHFTHLRRLARVGSSVWSRYWRQGKLIWELSS